MNGNAASTACASSPAAFVRRILVRTADDAAGASRGLAGRPATAHSEGRVEVEGRGQPSGGGRLSCNSFCTPNGETKHVDTLHTYGSYVIAPLSARYFQKSLFWVVSHKVTDVSYAVANAVERD